MSDQRANVIAYIEKGLHCFSIGQFEEARFFWHKALELDPHNAQVQEFLQYVSPQAQGQPGAGGELASGASRLSVHTPPEGQPSSRWSSWAPNASAGPSPSYEDVEEAWLPQEEEEHPWADPPSAPQRTASPRQAGWAGGTGEHPPFHQGRAPGSGSYPQDPRPPYPPPGASSANFPNVDSPLSPHPRRRSFDSLAGPPASSPGSPHSSGAYPSMRPPATRPPASQAPASRPPATRPPTGGHRVPASFAPSSANLHTGGPMPPQGNLRPPPSFSSSRSKEDLSTRFFPTIKQQGVQPDDLVEEEVEHPLGSPPGTDSLYEQDLAAPADAFSEAPPSSSLDLPDQGAHPNAAFAGTPPPPSQSRSRHDLSTRFLHTISSQQGHISPADLIDEPADRSRHSGSPLPPAADESSRDRSTRMVPSVSMQGVSSDAIKELIGESTQDSLSPFAENNATTPATMKLNTPLSSAALSPSGAVPDRSTRHLPTVKSRGEPGAFVPDLSPDDPTQVQPLPFSSEDSAAQAERHPLARSEENLSTQFFAPLPASPNDLLPPGEEIPGDSDPTPPSIDLMDRVSSSSSRNALFETAEEFIQEEPLSHQLRMSPAAEEDNGRDASVAYSPLPHTQPEAADNFSEQDLEFLLGEELLGEESLGSSAEARIGDDGVVDVASDDSLEVVFFSDEEPEPGASSAPVPEQTRLEAPSLPLERGTNLNQPPAPEDMDALADTGEFDAVDPSRPVVVKQNPQSWASPTNPNAAPRSSYVALDLDSPFEPMVGGVDPAMAETLFAGESRPAPASSDGGTSEHNATNVFSMPTSAASGAAENEGDNDLTILLSGIEDLLAEEDFVGAKELLDVAIQQDPENPKIKILYQLCEKKVAEIFREEFQSLEVSPRLAMPMDEVLNLRLNHRDGYILSQIDGLTSIGDLLAISGFEEDELFMILGQLLHRGVIHVE